MLRGSNMNDMSMASHARSANQVDAALKNLSDRVKVFRAEKNLTTGEFARLAGVTSPVVSRLEGGYVIRAASVNLIEATLRGEKRPDQEARDEPEKFNETIEDLIARLMTETQKKGA